MNGKTFRILSLDGGGIRGAYTAAVLASIEEAVEKPVADYFDLIVGTSTGGIIAIALGLGTPARQIQQFYLEKGPVIFPSARWRDRLLARMRWPLKPKHDRARLERALKSLFANRYLGESRCRLAIPAYNAVSNNVHVFKTAHDARFREDYKRRAVQVALATSAAPSYFPAAITESGELLIDGGIWANCPSMVGVSEALSLGTSLSEIQLLSIGTLGEARSFARTARAGGGFHYARALAALFMDAHARAAWSQTRLLLAERATRIDQVVEPGTYALDDARHLPDLIARGRYDGRHHAERILQQFLQHEAVQFSPIYATPSVS